MPRNEVSTVSDGREYVSVDEFARRTGCSAATIYGRIRLGLIPTETFGKKKIYIDWELGNKAYQIHPASVTFKRSTYEKREAKKAREKGVPYAKAEEHVSKPSTSVSIPSVDSSLEMRMEKTVDISSIDPSLLEDCTINGMVDWDMAKKKLTALTYAFDLDAKKGKYVEKAAIHRWALGMSKIIESALASIPNRYSAILNAELIEILEREAGRRVELTEEDKSRIRAHMDTVAPDIFRSIQSMLGEFADE